ncbi:hypothetical protein TNCV_5092021 [Trichonephila clavipes]|nr:hypothetical protein TNCV_5092021 [Trichonephila clavipes]
MIDNPSSMEAVTTDRRFYRGVIGLRRNGLSIYHITVDIHSNEPVHRLWYWKPAVLMADRKNMVHLKDAFTARATSSHVNRVSPSTTNGGVYLQATYFYHNFAACAGHR